MIDNWKDAFAHMIQSEGGYVNDPLDRGGETNLGVTKKAWAAYLGREIEDGEMAALTVEAVEPFYKTQYWDRVRADDLPGGVDYLAFDFAVNAGPARAAKFLQKAVGATADGVIGPGTLAAVRAREPQEVIDLFSTIKAEFYHGIVENDPTQQRFINGWLNRVAAVKQHASEMV
jgi:lysozyme family protein